MNGYELSRIFWDWAFENPDKVKPIHSAIFFFAIEHCNRLGWKDKFGFPSQMAMDAIGVKKYQTYGKALNELEEWGFIVFVERSKNQYSANIISLNAVPKNGKAQGKALDKAFVKHGSKQGQSTGQGMDSIDKQVNNRTNKQENGETRALEWLKQTHPQKFEQGFQMKYASRIRDKKKFAEDFNDKVDFEGIEFTDKKILSRLTTFARNWIENQDKYSRNENINPHSNIPIG